MLSLAAISIGLSLSTPLPGKDKCYAAFWHFSEYLDHNLAAILDRHAAKAGICFDHSFFHEDVSGRDRSTDDESCHALASLPAPRAIRMVLSGKYNVDPAKVGGFAPYLDAGLKSTSRPWFHVDVLLLCRKGIICSRDNLPNMRVAGVRNVKPHVDFLARAGQPVWVTSFRDIPKLMKAGRVDATVMMDVRFAVASEELEEDVQAVKLYTANVHGWFVDPDKSQYAQLDQAFLAARGAALAFKASYLEALTRGEKPACDPTESSPKN